MSSRLSMMKIVAAVALAASVSGIANADDSSTSRFGGDEYVYFHQDKAPVSKAPSGIPSKQSYGLSKVNSRHCRHHPSQSPIRSLRSPDVSCSDQTDGHCPLGLNRSDAECGHSLRVVGGCYRPKIRRQLPECRYHQRIPRRRSVASARPADRCESARRGRSRRRSSWLKALPRQSFWSTVASWTALVGKASTRSSGRTVTT